MRILLFAIGTRGDVQPFVMLGRALSARGHEVHIAAPSGYDAMIEAAGAMSHTLPIDFQALMEKPDIKAALTSLRGRIRAFQATADVMNEQLSTIWRIGIDVAPDVIGNHFKTALAPNLARKLGAVSMPIMLQPGFMPTHAYPQFFFSSCSLGGFGNLMSHRLILALTRFGTGIMVRRWQKRSGIDIGEPMDPMSAYSSSCKAPRIHAYSATICPRPDEWPETEVQTGYFFAEPEPFQPPEALKDFLVNGPTPIYIGFGSMPGLNHEHMNEAVVQALKRTGQRAIVATGWGGIANIEPSDRIHVVESVPHTWLFPRVAAVVHHGGSGTTHEGLRWGRPSVVCPVFADQPFFGRRVVQLGVGPEPIPHKNITGERLAAAIGVALTEEVSARARDVGVEIRKEQGIGRAVDLVEACAKRV
ncbi:MAG: glycosyltransferase family 1 protein [Hyphomicrobiaceae bacterium]